MRSSFVFFSLFNVVYSLCGSSIRWSHNVHMEDVYGMWYGVGYAQHSLDMSDRPVEIGCVTLYITDATVEDNEWLDWNFPRRNYSDQNWKSHKSNPWSDRAMSGSWLDIPVQRRFKRDYEERRVKVVWDEDGQTMERVYVYSVEEPGLWTAEKQWRPMEKIMRQRGIDVWYPDDPPYHPDVIRVLKVTPLMLIINRCSEVGASGVVSLILRRSPEGIERSEWYEIQRQFYKFELPSVQRYATVCAACIEKSVLFLLIFAAFLSRYLYYF